MDDFGLSDATRGIDGYEINGSGKLPLKSKIKSKSNISGIGASVSRSLDNAVNDMASIIDMTLREAIMADVWQGIDGTNVDIVSSSRLLNSQNVSTSGSRVIINYSVPYANLVHYGGYIVPYGNKNARAVYVPARPWVTLSLIHI